MLDSSAEYLDTTRGIVRKVPVLKKARPLYELTEQGRAFQQLLNRAEMPV
ncbi:MAG: hypothetical protein MJA84_09375 [Firmicutes bacterium]|nr:hypothetical protein [Bacillota bacterium]